MRNNPPRSGRTIKTFILGQPGATSTVTTSGTYKSSGLFQYRMTEKSCEFVCSRHSRHHICVHLLLPYYESMHNTYVRCKIHFKQDNLTHYTFVQLQLYIEIFVTFYTDTGSSPLASPKPSTEIRIRRISGTPSSPDPPGGLLRSISTSAQAKPRVRTLSASSTGTASTGKTPGQFLALSNLQQSHSESPSGITSADMQPGSLVFVQSNPTVNDKGEVTPGLVHIYMVSSLPAESSSPMPNSGQGDSTPCTPGGFKSNQFSLLRTPSTENAHAETKVPHSPSILRESPKRTPPSPHGTDGRVLADGQSISISISDSHNILEEPELAISETNVDSENAEIQTVEVMDVGASYGNSNILTVNEQQVYHTESITSDGFLVVYEDNTVCEEVAATAENPV